MPLVIPEGFAQVAYRSRLLEDPELMICTVGLDLSSVTGPDLDTCQDLLIQWQAAFPAAQTANCYTLDSVSMRIGNGTSTPDYVEVVAPQQGTAVQNPPPQNVTLLVKKLTNSGGRRNRGRMYVPMWMQPEEFISPSGVLSAASRTARQNSVDAWLGGTFGFVVLHSTGISSVPAPTPITSFVVDQRVATQRRRLRP